MPRSRPAPPTAAVVAIDLASGDVDVLKRALDTDLDQRYVSVAEPIEFPTAAGVAQTAHAFYYPPRNADFVAPGRRAAAADRDEPRRADAAIDGTLKPCRAVLDQPRLRGRST